MRIGYIIRSEKGFVVAEVGQYVKTFDGDREGTINQAEYLALIYALRHAVRLGFDSAECHVDSQLMARQTNGMYKTRDKRLAVLLKELKSLQKCFTQVNVIWDSRDKNTEADSLTKRTVFFEAGFTDPERGGGRFERKLPPWLAARIRRWWGANDDMNEGTVGRAVGLDITGIRQILKEKTYFGASETGLPEWDRGGWVLASLDDGTGWPDPDEVEGAVPNEPGEPYEAARK